MAEEKRLRDLTAALRGVLGGLKSMTVQKIEKDSG
jgi:hypothetical protein